VWNIRVQPGIRGFWEWVATVKLIEQLLHGQPPFPSVGACRPQGVQYVRALDDLVEELDPGVHGYHPARVVLVNDLVALPSIWHTPSIRNRTNLSRV
jgi:hypothetical protein